MHSTVLLTDTEQAYKYYAAVGMLHNNFCHQIIIQSVHSWNRLNVKCPKMIFSVSAVCTEYCLLLTDTVRAYNYVPFTEA